MQAKNRIVPSSRPKKDTAEYQRDKRLRHAAKRETAKNSWFQRNALSWPVPCDDYAQPG